MRQLLVAIAIVALSVGAARASDSTDVIATVNKFVEGFNTGDTLKLVATSAAEMSIIDEFPPFTWNGTGAWRKWMDDFGADATKKAITNPVVTIDKVKHLDMDGDNAYVITSANFDYLMQGKPTKQKGSSFVLVLHKGGDGWRVTAWSWARK